MRKGDGTRLAAAFNLQAPALVAFVGGGGKTSLMFALARALPGRVVVTTTTRIFAAQMGLATAVTDTEHLHDLGTLLAGHKVCLLVGRVAGDKALGVDPALPARLLARPDVDFVLVEADGSRMRPVKAPAEHEPVIPAETTLVVPVVGIDALDGRIADVAHRPALVLALLSEQWAVSSERLTVAGVAALLAHPRGGLKGVPAGARVIPFINKVETAGQLAAARQIARLLLGEPRIEQVAIGAVLGERPLHEVHKRVTAVVLAAGEAKRMGRTKQLLPWGDTTVLGRTLRNLRETAVHDILVVSGHEAEKVEAVAAAEDVRAIHNAGYASGEMLSSLQTAVAQLPGHVAAVLVMLADQPMVEPESINRLLAAYWQGEGTLIAPVFEGRRGNPVLIDRRHFAELLALPAGSAPRALLKRHPVHLVTAVSDSVLQDLDEWEAYVRLRPLATPATGQAP